MKRLLNSKWQRLGLQVALLSGIAIAFVVGTHEPPSRAEGGVDCPSETDCTFKKPNIMLIMDYSTSMNTLWDVPNNLTRWQVVVSSIKTVTQDGSFLSQNTHLALMRFGHDPAPAVAGTTIPNDSSGIVDGQKLDLPWYDAQNTPWFECNGAAIGAALDAAGDPIDGSLVGIGTWTKGAMDYAKVLIDQSVADHPQDAGERTYLNVVVTDGAWTGVDGTTTLAPANQNPAITAAALFDDDQVRTYVVAVAGDPNAEMAADSLATAGGTGPTAIDGDTPALLEQALGALVQDIIESVVAPECVGGLPRVMVLLDASSSMLNVAGGTQAGGPGQTGWDKARDALAGEVDSLFDLELVNLPGQAVEDVVHLGLAVFGHNAPAPGEQKILVDYGPCMKDNFAWALHPGSSAACTPVDADVCAEDAECGPGNVCRFGTCRVACDGGMDCGGEEVCAYGGCACDEDSDCGAGLCITGECHDNCSVDPWGGPPIVWDFQDGTQNPPGFDVATDSHMPQCAGNNMFCSGSGTYTHLGLQLIKTNKADYLAAAQLPNAPYPANDQTQFINILITDGQYTGYSTNAQVQAELEQMFADGITTYVIGFGDGVDTPAAIAQLGNMADWGSGATLDYYDANNQAALETALADIIASISFDPCCAFNDCSENPEPTTFEPDPVPSDDTETTESTTIEETTTATTVGDTAEESTTDDPTTAEESTTDEPTTTSGEAESSSSEGNDEVESDSSGAGSDGSDLPADDEGGDCNCASAPNERGLAGSLLLLGLAGLIRRRRPR
ncbi:MYXO-CTERM sorting domain-containing protein [Nannocystaceae bacterium ST9]